MITQIKAPHLIPAPELGEAVAANEPQGAPVAMIRSRDFHEAPDAGVWECTPGTWRRAIRNAEFAHFVAGRCRFHADSGETLDIRAGDAVYFPAHTTGTWEIIETVRKTYFLVPMT
jgi:hypothetical protein